MENLTFEYTLLYDLGDPETEPIGETEAPLNVIVVADVRGPVQAVIWDHPTETWTFRPDVAAAILFADPGTNRIKDVSRETAELETPRFATKPLPTEAELTAICRAARPA